MGTRHPRPRRGSAAALNEPRGIYVARSLLLRRKTDTHKATTTCACTGPEPNTSTHTAVGDLELAYDESVDVLSEAGLTLTIYAAEPPSRTADALALLASWTASAAERNSTASTP